MFLNPQQRLALDAVQRHLAGSQCGEVCFHWLPDEVKRLGVTQHHLKQLADLGYLSKVDTVRGGSRVYYRLGWNTQAQSQPVRRPVP